MSAEIIFYHGWGFDSSAWSQWCRKMDDAGIACQTAERGYFGLAPRHPHFGNSPSTKILVCHSLGLHLVDQSTLNAADCIVCFGGFMQFHLKDPKAAKRSRRVNASMLEKLDSDPLAVIEQFWTNCGLSGSKGQLACADINVGLLKLDLNLLNEVEMPLSMLKGKRITIVHGDEDAIVDRQQAEELAFAAGSVVNIVTQAGHALPFSHLEVCADSILTLVAKETDTAVLCK